ncbi:MAG: OmpA family protein [Pseudomonadota bacterium]|nr:OmpA family protein [Pseudomonadota bacterium]
MPISSRLFLAALLAGVLVSCSPPENTANASALAKAKVEILDQATLEELQSSFLEVSGSDRVAFAAGSAELTAKTRFRLERQALWLTANENVAIRLRTESASVRGVVERRLALRRAEVVRDYLKEVGVGSDQIVGVDVEYGSNGTVMTLIDKFHFGEPAARQASTEA